jgi:hypothetical protein
MTDPTKVITYEEIVNGEKPDLRNPRTVDLSKVKYIILDQQEVGPYDNFVAIGEFIFESDGNDSEVVFRDGKGHTENRRKFKKTNYRLYKGAAYPVEITE